MAEVLRHLTAAVPRAVKAPLRRLWIDLWTRGRALAGPPAPRSKALRIGRDYVYLPPSTGPQLSTFHLENVLLCLSHREYDFLLVGHTLEERPAFGDGSVEAHVIVKRTALVALEAPSSLALHGRHLRLLPGKTVETKLSSSGCQLLKNSLASDAGVKRYDCAAMNFIEQKKASGKPVVFVWPVFMAVGGVERNTIEIMRQLKDRYDFVLMTIERLSEKQGSLHHQLEGLVSGVYDLAELAPQDDFLSMLAALRNVYRPHLVWTCNGSPWQCDHAVQIREIFRNVPIVDQQVYDTKVGWVTRYQEPGIQSFDRFIAVNKKIQEVFLEKYRMNPDRVDLIYSALDTSRYAKMPALYDQRRQILERYGLPDDKEIFAFCGRLTAQKRPLDFVRLAEANQNDGSCFFLMLGDGDLTGEVLEVVARAGLENFKHIPFCGELEVIYSVCDALVITSEYEGLPIAMLEALAAGLPVLSTDVGEIKDLVEELETGVIVSCIGDLDSLQRGFERLRKRLPDYRARRTACSKRVQRRFSSRILAESYDQCWKRALSARTPADR